MSVSNEIWELIAKQASGNINDEEKLELTRWTTLKEENKTILHEAVNVWNETDKKPIQFSADAAWVKVKQNIIEESTTEVNSMLWYKLVAVFITGLILMFFVKNYILYKTVNVSESESYQTIEFPDGSLAYLNSGSNLTYPKVFNKKFRKIKLQGEAYFQVQPDVNRPFYIETQTVEVKVLGTSFNVIANRQMGTEVIVSSGRVEVVNKSNPDEVITLTKNESSKFINNQLTKNNKYNPNYASWHTNSFTFNKTRLVNVAKDLEKAYHVNIIFDTNKIKNMQFTSSFNNVDINQIIQTIAIAFNLEVHKSDKTYTFVQSTN